MPYIGGFLLCFGILIILNPDLIAYIIGFTCLIIGGNILLANLIFGRNRSHTVKFGNYEILRKK